LFIVPPVISSSSSPDQESDCHGERGEREYAHRPDGEQPQETLVPSAGRSGAQ
jgi:hypothetical protein